MAAKKCLRFKLETMYLANFRKPFSAITILSYSFPPYTTVRGLLANAMGLERDDYSLQDKLEISLKPLNKVERVQNMALMKKLKSPPDAKERKKLINKLQENNHNLDILDDKEKKLYEKLLILENTSAPFVKEFITPVSCMVYVMGDEKAINDLKLSLKTPKRPLYIGSSDDFVIISFDEEKDIFDVPESPNEISDEIDSIFRITPEIQPVDKKRIIGRVPYKFNVINKKKRDYSREDVIVASPSEPEQNQPNPKLKLNKAVECYKIGDEYITF